MTKPIDVFVMWADKPNANQRVYPLDVLKKAIADHGSRLIPVTDGLCSDPDPDNSKIVGWASLSVGDDGQVRANVECGKCDGLFDGNDPTFWSSLDFRLAGTGNLDDSNPGVVSDYKLSYISALPPGTGS